MAKARIVYEVDDKALKAVQKQLQKLKELGEDVPQELEEGFKKVEPAAKKTSGALTDLKGQLVGLVSVGAAATMAVEFAKLTQEVNKNRKEVAQLTNETGAALDKITAKLRATSSVFKKDFNEVLRAANTVSKEFGVSMTAALDEINEGFTRGLDVNGEYLQTLREYSTFIKEAGLNTRQFNVLIQQQAQQGIFSDKGIDAIKEAVISIREMTPVTRDALRNIGIDTDEMIKNIQEGTMTYFEAVQDVATRTREIADPQKTGAILADVFKGAGEDAGNFVFTLDQVGDSFAAVSAEQEAYILKQQKLLESSEDVNEELVKFSSNFTLATTNLRIWTNVLATESLKALNAFIGGFITLDSKMASFEESIKSLTIGELEEQIKELEKGPSFLEKFGAALSGGAFGVAEQGAEAGTQIAILRARIEALRLEQEQGNDVIEEETTARKNLAPILDEEAEKKERLKRINADLAQIKRDIVAQERRDEQALREEFDQEIIDDEKELQKQLLEINKMRIETEEELEKESIDRRRELIATGVDGMLDILGSFNDLRIQQIDNELQANELARNRELELAEGNADKQFEINKKFDEERNKLRTKQVNAQKQQSIFEAVVNTARAVAEALPNVPLSILAGVIGAAQVALIAAQPIPKFAKGVIDLHGPGTETSDSIPAYLSRGESVLTAQETKEFLPTLKAIRSREIKPEVINNVVLDKGQPNITINDYDKLADALLNRPENNTYVDENGFIGFMHKGMNQMRVKQNRFKM